MMQMCYQLSLCPTNMYAIPHGVIVWTYILYVYSALLMQQTHTYYILHNTEYTITYTVYDRHFFWWQGTTIHPAIHYLNWFIILHYSRETYLLPIFWNMAKKNNRKLLFSLQNTVNGMYDMHDIHCVGICLTQRQKERLLFAPKNIKLVGIRSTKHLRQKAKCIHTHLLPASNLLIQSQI